MQNSEFLREYLSDLNYEVIDGFRKLFYKSSDAQLNLIQQKLEAVPRESKSTYHDDGVEACYIRKLGGELVLIALYHKFEVKIKEIISLTSVESDATLENVGKLHRWDDIKPHIPTDIKETTDFQELNVLRLLVNCFKHSGIVDSKLYETDASFGGIDDEINANLEVLYEKYKKNISAVITATAEQLLFKN